MMRITAYADRLVDDLDRVDWPETVKMMQRNWIGRSTGRGSTSPSPLADGTVAPIEVFTTRPDTLFGATFMVLAPEHPLVDELVPQGGWPEGTRDAWTGRRRAHARRRPSRPTGRRPAQERGRAQRGQGQDRRLHRRLRHEPCQRERGSRSSSPTTS